MKKHEHFYKEQDREGFFYCECGGSSLRYGNKKVTPENINEE